MIMWTEMQLKEIDNGSNYIPINRLDDTGASDVKMHINVVKPFFPLFKLENNDRTQIAGVRRSDQSINSQLVYRSN